MTVADLINDLARFDLDAVVVLAKDIDGSGFALLDELDHGVYVPETMWSGEVRDAPDQRAPASGDAGAEIGPNGQKAVVLWPAS